MSALDHAFIRAFTSDTMASTSPPSKPVGELPSIGAALSRADESVRLPERAPAMAPSHDGAGVAIAPSVVPPPHLNLAAFAHTVSTLDMTLETPRKSGFRAVRIDPPQFLAGPPETEIKPSVPSKSDSSPVTVGGELPSTSDSPVSKPAPSIATLGQQAAKASTAERPRAAFEVDRFAWPTTCQSLVERIAPQLDQLCQDLMAESSLGRKVIAITGLQRNEGRTTLGLLLARRLAASGASVAIVDADFAAPQLASQLGLAIGVGWEQTLALGDGPDLWETMIESVADRLAVAPLASRTRLSITGDMAGRIADCLYQLREHFDIVLVDAGAVAADGSADWMLKPNSGLDAAILTTDTRTASTAELSQIGRRLMDANVPPLGVAENYCVL